MNKSDIEEGASLRLRALDRFDEVQERLINGWSLEETAIFVHQVLGELKDIARPSLIRILKRIRKEIAPGKIVATKAPSLCKRVISSAEQSLNVLDELKELYIMQKARIEIDHSIEKNLRKLMPHMHKEIKATREILEAYSKVQMDMGQVTRSLGVVTVTPAPAESEKVVHKTDNPVQREKLLSVVDRMMGLADLIDITPESDLDSE